jgi:hypothetical protein
MQDRGGTGCEITFAGGIAKRHRREGRSRTPDWQACSVTLTYGRSVTGEVLDKLPGGRPGVVLGLLTRVEYFPERSHLSRMTDKAKKPPGEALGALR